MKTARLIAFILLLLIPSLGKGQIVKRAQAGVRFLANPISAEAVGRGGIGTTMLKNATALFWNPAGMGMMEDRLNASLHYTRGIADINQVSFAFAWKAPRVGIMGLSLTRMDYGTFYQTHRATNEAGYIETGTFSPQAYAIGMGFARAMSDRFSFGIHAKWVHQDLGSAWIAEEEANANLPLDELTLRQKPYRLSVVAFDVGAYYDFQAYGLTFGAAIQHISKEVRYEAELFPLPFNVRFSLTFQPLQLLAYHTPNHQLVTALELTRGRDYTEHVQMGIQYTFLNQFILRAGYMTQYQEKGPTFGMGFHLKQVTLDYAYQYHGVFGGIHLLSTNFHL